MPGGRQRGGQLRRNGVRRQYCSIEAGQRRAGPSGRGPTGEGCGRTPASGGGGAYAVAAHSFSVALRIGITHAPDGATDAEELLSQAELALEKIVPDSA